MNQEEEILVEDQEDSNVFDEEQLFFKRFPAEKQDQVRGLVNYATLMGLTGKDLVSIGGKLDRLKDQRELARNKEIVKNINAQPIGQDRKRYDPEAAMDDRFKIIVVGGSYSFVRNYSDGWKIQSSSTKVIKTHQPDEYHLGRVGWRRRLRYAMMLDIANGKFQLNF